MHPLEKKTLLTIRRENLLAAGEKVVIGVSGGPDSMALMHVLAGLAPVLDITPAAVYVNHGLRPHEAKRELHLAAGAAAHLGLAFFSGAVDVKGLAAGQKLSVEHAARLLRYQFLENIVQEWGAQKIALAHTADDQAEETLLRLLRGTARKGLSGMKTFRAPGVVRPFLSFPKSRILAYLDRYSIPFLLDSSNRQNSYLRNRVRNDLLPYLAERYNPDIRQTLIRTAAILQDEEELLETMTNAAFTETVATVRETAAQTHDCRSPDRKTRPRALELCLAPFTAQPRAIQRRILEKCCWRMDCTPRSRQIEQILQLAGSGSAATTLHLAGGLRITKNKEHLTFAYPCGCGPLRGDLATGNEKIPGETMIPAPGIYPFPLLKHRLVVEEIAESGPGPGILPAPGEDLDADLFAFPLILRWPRKGDRFHPLGAPGSKKVLDFLSDQKIERTARKLVPVVCAGASILGLPGLRIDNRFRITEKTVRVLRLRWEKMTGETAG